MTKRIKKKHKAIATKVYEESVIKDKKPYRYYTWRRTKFIMTLMRIYYDRHYYHEEGDTITDKFRFW